MRPTTFEIWYWLHNLQKKFFKKRFFEFFRDLRWGTNSRPRGDIQVDLSNFSIYKLLETMRPIFPETCLNYYFLYSLIQPVVAAVCIWWWRVVQFRHWADVPAGEEVCFGIIAGSTPVRAIINNLISGAWCLDRSAIPPDSGSPSIETRAGDLRS